MKEAGAAKSPTFSPYLDDRGFAAGSASTSPPRLNPFTIMELTTTPPSKARGYRVVCRVDHISRHRQPSADAGSLVGEQTQGWTMILVAKRFSNLARTPTISFWRSSNPPRCTGTVEHGIRLNLVIPGSCVRGKVLCTSSGSSIVG